MFVEIVFRPLSRFDFPLLQRWLAASHVEAWWHQAPDPAGLEKKYGPRVDGAEPTHVFVIEYRKRPIGFVQWYRWSDYAEHAALLGAKRDAAGIDLAIGEPDMIGLGLGPQVIRIFVKDVIFSHRDVKAVVTDVAMRNFRSLRAFEKAGFDPTDTVQLPGEDFQRRVLRLRGG